MFFCISKTARENFPEHHYLGDLVLNVDAGWQYQRLDNCEVVFKGYADPVNIKQCISSIISQHEPKYTGNYCIFKYELSTKNITIHTDLYRGFPIFVGKDQITNLLPQDQTIWTDSLLTIHNDLRVSQSWFDAVGNIETSRLSADDVISNVIDILDKRTQDFLLHNRLPIKSYLSGGVDSLLVYSFLKKHKADVELVNYEHVEYDWFWTQSSGDIKKNWGYKQIHHWQSPCVLSSGAPGDEYMLRSPDTANQFLLFNGTSIPEQLTIDPNSLHSKYFQQSKHQLIFNAHLVTESTQVELHRKLCNIVLNDWQHWHIGNTLTWTPLRDLEIFKLFLRLNLNDAIGQIMNSDISKKIIEINCPGMSSAISDQKNSNNLLSNLGRYFIQH